MDQDMPDRPRVAFLGIGLTGAPQARDVLRARVREALRGGFAESRILDLHAGRLVARDLDHSALLLEMERRNPTKAAGG